MEFTPYFPVFRRRRLRAANPGNAILGLRNGSAPSVDGDTLADDVVQGVMKCHFSGLSLSRGERFAIFAFWQIIMRAYDQA